MVQYKYAPRLGNVRISLIRDLTNLSNNEQYIPLIGNQINLDLIDNHKFSQISSKVYDELSDYLHLYNITEGYLELRKLICEKYKKRHGINLDPDNILITNGSQEALDLISKVFISKNDSVLIEEPTYPGAIQLFSIYEPLFHTISIGDNGIDIPTFNSILSNNDIRIFYSIPTFHNPTGFCYSEYNRVRIAETVKKFDTIIIEDDVYGELGFNNEKYPLIQKLLPNQTIVIGSISKYLSPGIRLGWIIFPHEMKESFLKVKQATNLHTDFAKQIIYCNYLSEIDYDRFIFNVQRKNRIQCELIIKLLDEYMPNYVMFKIPKGGLYIWINLPDCVSSQKIHNLALLRKVIVLPGTSFYIGNEGQSKLRITISHINTEKLKQGIIILSELIKELYGSS